MGKKKRKEKQNERDADFDSLNIPGEDGEEQAGDPAALADSEANEDEASGDDETSVYLRAAKEAEEKYLRTLADFENFKKRSIKERSQLLKYEGERIFSELLEVVDDFERALAHENSGADELREGLRMVYKKMSDFLSKWQVTGESGVGSPFDPTKQSALSEVPTDEHEPGAVVEEFTKTYFYKDKLLRVGQVVVARAAQKPDEAPETEESEEES